MEVECDFFKQNQSGGGRIDTLTHMCYIKKQSKSIDSMQ